MVVRMRNVVKKNGGDGVVCSLALQFQFNKSIVKGLTPPLSKGVDLFEILGFQKVLIIS